MLGTTDLSTYLIGVVAIVLLPGPNSMYCLATAGQYGAKTAYRSVAGIFLGDSTLMLLTALGAASAIKAEPALFWLLKILGGLYLAYLGMNLWRAAIKKWRIRPLTGSAVLRQMAMPDTGPRHVFRRALMLSLLNPKAILFFLSFFVPFVDVHYPHPALSFLLLAAILQTVSMMYLSLLIFSGVSLTHWFGHYQKMAASGMALVGTLFLGFAAKLWTATVN